MQKVGYVSISNYWIIYSFVYLLGKQGNGLISLWSIKHITFFLGGKVKTNLNTSLKF